MQADVRSGLEAGPAGTAPHTSWRRAEGENALSLEQRRTDLVRAVIDALVADGHRECRPGDVVSRLREWNQPMGAWEVRGELSKLEAAGEIELEPAAATWRRVNQPAARTG